MRKLLYFLLLPCFFAACESDVAVPKPRAYPRVIYPEKKYEPFERGYCAFTFEKPAYAQVEQDTLFFDKRPNNECWFNLSVPTLAAKIHCSYSAIGSRKEFDELVQDAHALANKHTIKATFIENLPVHRPADKVDGVVFDIQGPTASAYQFYLTDSTRHFFRGALYFNTQSQPDSLAPVIEFMKKDVNRLVQTLRWQ